jgi:release factor glutamine methyltransferase
VTALVTAGITVGAARRLIAQRFRAAALDSPDLDARVLVGHALGRDHAALASSAETCLSSEQAAAIAELARRRLAGEPVARILGRKEFWGLTLQLGPATLVPRPETETVIEAALAHAPRRERALRILDIGTGSGALLLALLTELPTAWGVGTDVSLAALAVARRNAQTLGVAARATFVRCDLAAALRGGFDLIVSNPPYIPSNDITALATEVRQYDPVAALDGGADGLDLHRAIAADARTLLATEGVLVTEVGVGQAAAVQDLLRAAGLRDVEVRNDLAGAPRAVVAHA